jgi:hypothetical protein
MVGIGGAGRGGRRRAMIPAYIVGVLMVVLQIASVMLVALGMSMALAHALELPGKLRLDKEQYLTVQTIYYPGFTIGGIFGEPGAMLATLALLIFTPFASTAFWLILAAFVGLLIMHGVFWLVTQPVNRVWLEHQQLRGASAAFFGVGAARESQPIADRNWTVLRDRWEYSYLARAVLAALSLVALVAAVTCGT